MLTRSFARAALAVSVASLGASCSGSDSDLLDDSASRDATVDFDSINEDHDGGQNGHTADAGSSTTPPTITFVGTSEVVIDCGATFVDPGAQAHDAAGNPLTVELTDAARLQTSAPGRFQIHYRALDANGNSAELARDVFVCGPSCGDLGKDPINLSGWSVVQYEQNDQPDANWSLSEDQLSVTQTVNADASILLSDFDATDYAVEGSWRMPSSAGDDDFVGFVFGYQDRGHFYLFDWKQNTQAFGSGVAEAGITLKRVAASMGDASVADDAGADALQLGIDDLWFTAGTDNVSVLTDASGQPYHNAISWQYNTDYTFLLEFHAGNFRIEVRAPGDGGETVLASWSVHDETFESGKFGFYNYSQGPVVYQTFTRRVTPPACSSVD